METFKMSISASENDEVVKELTVELKALGQDKFQPVIKAYDNRTGFKTTTELPVSDYIALRSKVTKLTSMDALEVEKSVRKLVTFISWAG